MNLIAKKIFTIIVLIFILTSCVSCTTTKLTNDDGKLNVVCTVFPQYDFVRQIAGDKVNLTMLLKPGSEAHSYEPSPKDIANIQNCDLFIMIGGKSEEWANKIISSSDKNFDVLKLIDLIEPFEEEITEGMEHEHAHYNSYDEHIWTSPENAITLSKEIANTLSRLDEKNKATYEENLKNYTNELKKLSAEFKNVKETGKRDTIIIADRFPFRYLTESIGLEYFAAFPGCSSKTEPSASTVAFLIDKIRNENIPTVICVDYNEGKIANSIKNETGAKILRMYSCHIITKNEFENGETYIGLMQKNITALKEALNWLCQLLNATR